MPFSLSPGVGILISLNGLLLCLFLYWVVFFLICGCNFAAYVYVLRIIYFTVVVVSISPLDFMVFFSFHNLSNKLLFHFCLQDVSLKAFTLQPRDTRVSSFFLKYFCPLVLCYA